jgi:hypothetical protein
MRAPTRDNAPDRSRVVCESLDIRGVASGRLIFWSGSLVPQKPIFLRISYEPGAVIVTLGRDGTLGIEQRFAVAQDAVATTRARLLDLFVDGDAIIFAGATSSSIDDAMRAFELALGKRK